MIVRVFALPHAEARKIRARQLVGTMKTYIDERGYICYDDEELANYQPKKDGRKPQYIFASGDEGDGKE